MWALGFLFVESHACWYVGKNIYFLVFVHLQLMYVSVNLSHKLWLIDWFYFLFFIFSGFMLIRIFRRWSQCPLEHWSEYDEKLDCIYILNLINLVFDLLYTPIYSGGWTHAFPSSGTIFFIQMVVFDEKSKGNCGWMSLYSFLSLFFLSSILSCKEQFQSTRYLVFVFAFVFLLPFFPLKP